VLLPAYRRRDFEDFLRDRGVPPAAITAQHKIEWLASLVRESLGISWSTLDQYGRGLSVFASGDDAQQAHQRAIVRAFTLELRHHRGFQPPEMPAPAMPLSVFRALMLHLRPRGTAVSRMISRARIRCILKLAFRTGIRLSEALVARRSWIIETEFGYIFHCRAGFRRQHRQLEILYSDDLLTCAATELENWLRFIPDDPNGILFPTADLTGHIRPSVTYDEKRFLHALRRYLNQIDARQYDYSSIRRSFLKRSYVQLGEAKTFVLSGYSSPDLLRRNLRAEPDWASVPTLF
jgi:hypothetical protein